MIKQNIGKSIFPVMEMMIQQNLKVLSIDDKLISPEEDTSEFCSKHHN